MPLKRTKPKDEAKHEAILKSATRLFLKQGYSNTSMEAIADDARVTKQTVYSHFTSKDVLFSHMILALSKKHTPSDALLVNSDQPIEETLNEIGVALLSMLTSKEGLAATRLVIAELHHHPELAKRYYDEGTQRMVDMLAEFLEKQHKQKKLHIKDTPSAAACFFSMLKGRYYVRMLLNVQSAPDQKEKESHVRETVGHFLKLYGRP